MSPMPRITQPVITIQPGCMVNSRTTRLMDGPEERRRGSRTIFPICVWSRGQIAKTLSGGFCYEGRSTQVPANPVVRYITAAGIAKDRHGWLFRTSKGTKGTALSSRPMVQADAWRVARRRAEDAGIKVPVGCHTFRATGITTYLANGGTLEHAQFMAAHENPRTTKLYDRNTERLAPDEIERIRF
jgi:integrase